MTELNGFAVGQTVKILRVFGDTSRDEYGLIGKTGTIVSFDDLDDDQPYRVRVEGHYESWIAEEGKWVSRIEAVDVSTSAPSGLVSGSLPRGTRIVVVDSEPAGDDPYRSTTYDGMAGEYDHHDSSDDSFPHFVKLDNETYGKWVHSIRLENASTTVSDGLAVSDTVTYNGSRSEYRGHQGRIVSLSDQYAHVTVNLGGHSETVRVARNNLVKVDAPTDTSTETPVNGDRVRYTNQGTGGRADWVGREGVVERIGAGRGRVRLDNGSTFDCKIENLTKLVPNGGSASVTTFNEGDEVRITGMNGNYPVSLEGETATYIRLNAPGNRLPYFVRMTSGEHRGTTMNVYSIEKVGATSVAGKTAEQVQAEFDAFKRKVVEEARIAARANDMCSVVDALLKHKLGLSDFYPTVKKATITIELDETETASLLAGGLETANGTRVRAWLRDNVVRSASARAEITETPITRVAVR